MKYTLYKSTNHNMGICKSWADGSRDSKVIAFLSGYSGRPRYPVVNAATTVKSIHYAAGTSVTVADGVVFNELN